MVAKVVDQGLCNLSPKHPNAGICIVTPAVMDFMGVGDRLRMALKVSSV